MDRLKFTVLVLCGTACVLASFGGFAYMYHLHVQQLTEHVSGTGLFVPGTPHLQTFTVFVGVPSLLTFAVGLVLIGLGLKVGSDD